MEKEKGVASVVGIGVLMTVLLVTVPLVFVTPAYARPAEWHVYPGDSIQAAVDSASSGDIIYVHPGYRAIYNEEVRINKSVTIIAVEEWVQTGWDVNGTPLGREMKPRLVGDPSIFVITDFNEWSYLSIKGNPVSAPQQQESVPAFTPLGMVVLVFLLAGIVAGLKLRRR